MNEPRKRHRLVPRWRKMTWIVFAWNTLMALWIVGAIAGSTGDKAAADCIESAGEQLCNDAGDVGTGIGVILLIMLWFVVFMALAVAWFATRPRQVVVVHQAPHEPSA